ncbi:oleosin H2-like [Humulus lupulus]|uniref:oleosin H2-like n=1 Tax=Humulus lupulus TaxID=3486 RepID=UPI002B40DE0B|nr:oleosin H2-like [Humulus lupulus]
MADYQRTQYGQQQQQPQSDATKSILPEGGPSAQQILTVVTLVPLGGILLLLAGLTLAGTLLGVAISTPVFVIFSPVLVPAAFVIAAAVTGFLTSGAFGITGLSSLSWLANYLRRIRMMPSSGPLPEAAEYARRRVQESAGYVGQKTKEAGQAIQSKAQESGGRAQEGTKT